jgi:hypothetical protein
MGTYDSNGAWARVYREANGTEPSPGQRGSDPQRMTALEQSVAKLLDRVEKLEGDLEHLQGPFEEGSRQGR